MKETSEARSSIDIREMFGKVWQKKRVYYVVWALTVLLSCIYIYSVPRYYVSESKLSPEAGEGAGNTIGGLATQFGLNIGGIENSDAIFPMIYPDLMEDNEFVTGMFNIKVRDVKGEINTTYYEYLSKHQKLPWWTSATLWVKRLFIKRKPVVKSKFDPYALSEFDHNLAMKIRTDIQLNYNDKTEVVTVKTKAQDPLVSKILADSVMGRLQEFIIKYRTNKARIDYEYYKKLVASAKQDYERVRRQYGMTSDANMDVNLKSVELRVADLENDMQLKFNAYSAMCAQLEAAKAKVQEKTPAFTVIKGAEVPVKPAGPKRVMFVFFMLVLVTLFTTCYVLRQDILRIVEIKPRKD